MPSIVLECQNCFKLFPSGINMRPGASATIIGCKSRCPYCGSWENIPDGNFKMTLDGVLEIIKTSANPLKDLNEILDGLNKAKRGQDFSKNPRKDVIEQFLKNNKYKIGILIVIIKIIIQLLIKDPLVKIDCNILNNEFYNSYNQLIEVEIENEDDH
jgi:hypothetical protein